MFGNQIRQMRGFTLIELMIVVVIIGILAALAIPRFMTASTRAKQSEAKQILKQIYEMQSTYREANNTFGDLGQTRFAGGVFPQTGVDIMSTARYVYTITGTATTFLATAAADPGAGGQDLDDDATVDTWTIDDSGNLQNTINDVTG